MTKQYFRRELDGHLVWSDFESEANQYVAEKYTRITRAKWREYKRVQRAKDAESIKRQLALVREHDAESIAERERLVSESKEARLTERSLRVNYEDAMSEEPYL